MDYSRRRTCARDTGWIILRALHPEFSPPERRRQGIASESSKIPNRCSVLSPAVLVVAAFLIAAPASHAQQQTAPSASQSGQVQGYTLSPAQEAQAIAYARARHELYFFDVTYGFSCCCCCCSFASRHSFGILRSGLPKRASRKPSLLSRSCC